MAKRFLLIPDLENNRKISDAVIENFMRNGFMTDSALFVFGKGNKIFSDYANYTMRKIFNRTCQVNFYSPTSQEIEPATRSMTEIISVGSAEEVPFINVAKKFNVPIIQGGGDKYTAQRTRYFYPPTVRRSFSARSF